MSQYTLQYDALPSPRAKIGSKVALKPHENPKQTLTNKISESENELMGGDPIHQQSPDSSSGQQHNHQVFVEDIYLPTLNHDVEDVRSVSSASVTPHTYERSAKWFGKQLSLSDELAFLKFILRTHHRDYFVILMPLVLFACLLAIGLPIISEQV